jgi:hypothetical protein
MNYRAYLAKIGAKGGKKSKRRLTKKDAREMARKRWDAHHDASLIGLNAGIRDMAGLPK